MRRLCATFSALGFLTLIGLMVGAIPSCDAPDYGDMPFLCGDQGACPLGFECHDNVCLRKGTLIKAPGAAGSGGADNAGGSAGSDTGGGGGAAGVSGSGGMAGTGGAAGAAGVGGGAGSGGMGGAGGAAGMAGAGGGAGSGGMGGAGGAAGMAGAGGGAGSGGAGGMAGSGGGTGGSSGWGPACMWQTDCPDWPAWGLVCDKNRHMCCYWTTNPDCTNL